MSIASPSINLAGAIPNGYTSRSPQSRPVVNAAKNASSGSVGSIEDIFNQALNQGKTIVKYGWGLWNIGIATVLGIGSGIGATFFKDNTTADIASKVGIVGAIITAVVGLFQIKKTNSEQNKAKETKLKWEISEPDRAAVWQSFTELNGQAHGGNLLKPPSSDTNNPNDVFNLTQESLIQHPANDLDENNKSTWDLLAYSGIYRLQLIKLLTSIPNPVLNNGNIYELTGLKSDQSTGTSINTLKDEIAFLTGVIAANDNGQYPAPDLSSEKSLRLMPEEFQAVYNATPESTDSTELNTIITNLSSITPENLSALDYTDPANTDHLQTYLSAISDTYNNLKIIEKASRETINEAASSDPNTLRKIGLYRSALISAYDIKGNSIGEIQGKIQSDIFSPVSTALTKLEEHVKKLKEVTSSSESPKDKIPFILQETSHNEFGELLDFSRKVIPATV